MQYWDKDESWREQSACATAKTELFFPPEGSHGNQAKAICHTCPVKDECLEWALSTHQEDGIWGELNGDERRKLRRRRREAIRRQEKRAS